MTTEEMMSDPTIELWVKSAGFDAEPEREQLARVEVLRQFCERVDMTPGEVVETCWQPDDGKPGREIDIKGRQRINAEIDEFAETCPGPLFTRTFFANIIRSFLTHNGILIQGPPVV